MTYIKMFLFPKYQTKCLRVCVIFCCSLSTGIRMYSFGTLLELNTSGSWSLFPNQLKVFINRNNVSTALDKIDIEIMIIISSNRIPLSLGSHLFSTILFRQKVMRSYPIFFRAFYIFSQSYL